MKQILAGGFLFLGGCILYAVGTLGYASINVQPSIIQPLITIGMIAMIAGVILGAGGLFKKLFPKLKKFFSEDIFTEDK